MRKYIICIFLLLSINCYGFDTTIFEDHKNEDIIRQQWENWLGIDIWQPYYLVKDIEHKVNNKISHSLWGFRCKLSIKNNGFILRFKKGF